MYYGYNHISIPPNNQENTSFTYTFGTYAYNRMSFYLYSAPSIFLQLMLHIFSKMVAMCMEAFMDDFTVYSSAFDDFIESLEKVLIRCEKNLMFNCKKYQFMVTKGIVLGHIISPKAIEVDKTKKL